MNNDILMIIALIILCSGALIGIRKRCFEIIDELKLINIRLLNLEKELKKKMK